MIEKSKSKNRSSTVSHQDEAPVDLHYALIALNSGIWVGNFCGFVWTGVVSLVLTAIALFALDRVQRTLLPV